MMNKPRNCGEGQGGRGPGGYGAGVGGLLTKNGRGQMGGVGGKKILILGGGTRQIIRKKGAGVGRKNLGRG